MLSDLERVLRPADLKPPQRLNQPRRGKGKIEKMKQFKKLGVILIALFAVSALAASTASAEVTFLLAEWLLEGAPITTADPVETEGELNLVNLNAGGFGITAELLCSGIFDGTVGPGSVDTTTELLELGTLTLITPTHTLSCANTKNCEGALVVPVGLPWKTEIELMEDNGVTFFADLLFNAGYEATCTILGVKVKESCKAEVVSTEKTNAAGGVVDDTFSEAFQLLSELKLGECGGRAETAETTGLGTIKAVGGGSLTVSE